MRAIAESTRGAGFGKRFPARFSRLRGVLAVFVWPAGARSPRVRGHGVAHHSGAFPALSPAGYVQPCRPTLVSHPSAGPGWLHEMKHDSYRLMARKDAESRAIAFDRAEQQLSARRT
jgi:hypothetical protein